MPDLESLILTALINLLLRGMVKIVERRGSILLKKLKAFLKRD